MREIVHLQAGQCGNQIGAKVKSTFHLFGKIWFFGWIAGGVTFNPASGFVGYLARIRHFPFVSFQFEVLN